MLLALSVEACICSPGPNLSTSPRTRIYIITHTPDPNGICFSRVVFLCLSTLFRVPCFEHGQVTPHARDYSFPNAGPAGTRPISQWLGGSIVWPPVARGLMNAWSFRLLRRVRTALKPRAGFNIRRPGPGATVLHWLYLTSLIQQLLRRRRQCQATGTHGVPPLALRSALFRPRLLVLFHHAQ
jgi:hypothetical protein